MLVRNNTGLKSRYLYTKLMVSGALADLTTRKTVGESITAHFNGGLLMHFPTGQTIINGLDEPEGVYLIKSGFIKAYSISEAGNMNLLLIHRAGEFIPMPWALDGAHTSGMFYEAMSDVIALRTSKDSLRNAMGTNTWLFQEVLKQTTDIITVYTQRIQTLQFRSARGRIIAELLYLAERFGKNVGTEIIIYAPVTHQDIADSINMNRETASRAFELLLDEGLVGQRDHLFTIMDLTKLRLALS
jgi:CRP-like cAMP-binding protein